MPYKNLRQNTMPPTPSTDPTARKTKHREIYEYLRTAITSGNFQVGDRFPSEIELAQRFRTSRPTVARAFRDLQQEGLVERIAGSGTYVRDIHSKKGLLFGLLVPGLGETEIFEPICAQIAHETRAQGHTLLWSESGPAQDLETDSRLAEQTCREYVDRQVAGAFVALERLPEEDDGSLQIIEALNAAHIPIVLLDRDIVRYPHRSRYDLVGIDSRRAGYLVAEHLLEHGCRRIDFVGNSHHGPTSRLRILGYQEALRDAGIEPSADWLLDGAPDDIDFVRGAFASGHRKAVICVNDVSAARLMQCLDQIGLRIPDDVRIAAFDDVKYASIARVPLTTIHQPCKAIGTAVFGAMMERVKRPEMPARDIFLDAHLVVRASCGTHG